MGQIGTNGRCHRFDGTGSGGWRWRCGCEDRLGEWYPFGWASDGVRLGLSLAFGSGLRTPGRFGHSYPLGSASIRIGCPATGLGSLPPYSNPPIEGAFFLVFNTEHAALLLRAEFNSAVCIIFYAFFALEKFGKRERSKLGSRTRVVP